MRKHILITAFILVFTVSLFGFPLAALSADELSFADDTGISLDNGLSFTVINGSLADDMTVYSSYVTFTLSANSSVELRSGARILFTSVVNTDCSNNSYSKLVLSGNLGSVNVTPSSDTCPSVAASSGGGGGGGVSVTAAPAPSAPTTTTGQVTATASQGGKTTLTTSENTIAGAELPANAVSASTEVKIVSEAKANILASRPIPSGKSVVGGYVYNYTATAANQTVSTFLKEITLTFTYTDTQISGLDENTLKAYYWDGTQWLALTSAVDKANNKITAKTTHFTYFVIMGEAEAPVTMAKPEDYDLKEGDLIRAVGDFDIFIINEHGYKRLFLNPAIFEMYGHLGSWDDVKSVAPSTRDAFITSSHYRYVDEDKVYHLEVTGEDTGILQWINMTAEDFLAQGGNAKAIFTINKSELDWYSKGVDKTSL